MLMVDVNVLVYAFRQDSPHHEPAAAWLEGVVNGDEAYAMADLVLSGFLRVVTHPRVFAVPSSIEEALDFVEQVRSRPQCVTVAPDRATGNSLLSFAARQGSAGISCPTPIWLPWPSSRGASGSQAIAATAAFPGCGGASPW